MNGSAPQSILVLKGGPDAEREVSIASGTRVATALATFDDLRVVDRTIERPDVDELRGMVEDARADVVFPVLHGPWGEGGSLQALLEAMDIPFVGSGSVAASHAMDKLRTKATVASLGIATPAAVAIEADRPVELPPPLVVKPVADGSSVGVRMARTTTELEALLGLEDAGHGRLMAEALVEGRELTVGLLGGRPLPIIEIVPSEGWYDYEAKYERSDTRYVVEPSLPAGVAERLHEWSGRIAEAMSIRDLGRVDWMLPAGDAPDPRPMFLEVNTIPGMTDHSLLPKAAAATGVDFPTLCRSIVDSAATGPSRTA